VRKINLCLDSFRLTAAGAGRLSGRAVTLARPAQMGAHLLRLVILERTGMGLLFRYADFLQDIEDRFAFNF
jgi:hypothetical protein